MKLRNIFTMLAAALAFAFVGCQEEERFLDEVQVSQSVVSLPIDGGSAEVTINATAEWAFAEIPDVWPNVVVRDDEGNVESTSPSWLSVDVMNGTAGETVVKLTAEASKDNNEIDLNIVCAGQTQVLRVIQLAAKVDLPVTDCATVLAENSVGTVYKCKGTITDLTNYDKYGCFYINDGTATVYVYGSMNPAQFSPEVGDIITFEGPWTSYGNFDDVTILSLEKSLLKVEKVFPEEALPLEGGVATVLLTVKDGDLVVEIPEDATWLTAAEEFGNIGGMTSVELTAAPNEGGARKTTVTFKVNVDGKDYFAMVDVEQLGAIAEVSVADFLAAEVGTSLFKLTGKVANLANTTYGNFDLVDATGSVYVYGLTATPVASNDKSFESLGIKEGDIVTLIGTRADYKGDAQVGGPAYYVSHEGHTEATVAEFLAKEVGDSWYKLTGKVSNVANTAYGNFDLVDETGTVYVYGLTAAPVASNDKTYESLGINEGDIVTLIGKRADYKGTAQVGGPAYYISHEAGAPAVDPWETAETYILPESASSSRQVLREMKYYADANNVNVRLTASAAKIAETATNYLTIMIYDTVAGTSGAGFYGWWNDAKGNSEFAAEHCGVVSGTELTLNIGGADVAVEKTEEGDVVTWTFAIPRSVSDVLKNSEAYIGILAMKDWDATGAMPDKYADMLKVTLP